MDTSSGIYKISSIHATEIYVGSAINFKNRWRWHVKDLKAGKHRNSYLQNAWNKYLQPSFNFEIIELCEKEKLIEREQYWIDKLNCVRPNGYNLAPKAGSSLGIKRSLETREKQRQAKLGKKQTPERIEARVSQLRGKPRPPHVLAALAKANVGNKHGLGFRHTEETKAKISSTHKGKPKSEEHKKKMSMNAKLQFSTVTQL